MELFTCAREKTGKMKYPGWEKKRKIKPRKKKKKNPAEASRETETGTKRDKSNDQGKRGQRNGRRYKKRKQAAPAFEILQENTINFLGEKREKKKN